MDDTQNEEQVYIKISTNTSRPVEISAGTYFGLYCTWDLKLL
jgi:hypothetical protein